MTIDFTSAGTVLGTAFMDMAGFMLDQTIELVSALALVGAVVALLIAALRGLGIHYDISELGESRRRKQAYEEYKKWMWDKYGDE